jgi:hypothetical protein
MKIKTLSNIFIGVGALLTSLSALWWGVVYHFVSKMNNESMWDSLTCMGSLSAECNLLRAMGWMRGVNPYEPMLFWFGLTVLVMALLLKSSALKEINRLTDKIS